MSSAGYLLSLVVHVATFLALGALPGDPPPDPNLVLEIAVVEQPSEPPPEAPAEPEPPEPTAPEPVKPPPPKPRAAPKPAEEPPPPEEEPPAPAPETIADFSGTTLTGQGGWTSAVGSGGPMNSPIGAANALVTGRNRDGVAGGEIGGAGLRVLPESDLSRRPKPPSPEILNAALVRSYPKGARQQGIEGVARIRLRVLASGKLQALATLNESFPGFADACKTSLHDMNFQPGLDGRGQPVATDITYTCRFSVE